MGDSDIQGFRARCSQCVLPRSATTITFDANGTCSLCNAAKAQSPTSGQPGCAEGDVEEHIQEIRKRGRGRRYDCVVGISGGRDSTYLLWLLVTKHHLRCLAAYYRTPFTPEVIHQNVRRLVTHLNVPLVEMDISQEYHLSIARRVVRFWLRHPQPAIANLTCGVCKFVNREVYRIAQHEGVPSIIYGGTRFEIYQFGAVQTTRAVAAHGNTGLHTLGASTRKMFRVVARGIGALSRSWELWRYLSIGVKSAVLYINPHTPWLRFRYPGIHTLEYFHHTEWMEEEAEKSLREVGWELPPGANMTWRADCSFGELKNRMFAMMTGITYVDAFFSNMIRAGVLTREEGLRRLATEGNPSPERLGYACRLLELDPVLFSDGNLDKAK